MKLRTWDFENNQRVQRGESWDVRVHALEGSTTNSPAEISTRGSGLESTRGNWEDLFTHLRLCAGGQGSLGDFFKNKTAGGGHFIPPPRPILDTGNTSTYPANSTAQPHTLLQIWPLQPCPPQPEATGPLPQCTSAQLAGTAPPAPTFSCRPAPLQ